jgi:aerobic carbon-monoxide dehydrogenase small subunit
VSTDSHELTLTVNGEKHTVTVESRRHLAEVLREELGLTGTHLGCEHGVCGACTVSLDGAAVRSCLVLAVQADGAEVVTVEGLAGPDGGMGPLQRAMWDNHAFQCAFCAPGFLMTLDTMLAENPAPSAEELKEGLSGNLCRCTGYHSILAGANAAVASLAEQRRAGASDA